MIKRIFSYMLMGLVIAGMSGCEASSSRPSSNREQAGAQSTKGTVPDYAGSIFDASYVHTINIEISEDDWKDMLANPTEKTKYAVTVTIDGTVLNEVSFATKGNTSLQQVASSDSDRYSFKLNFSKFADGQSYDGLDKLNLNNTYGDATYLKDYLSYRIMAETGAAAPLVSFVSLSINGGPYGLYAAVEEIDSAFLERNFGKDAGELYKPETSRLGNMAGRPGGQMPAPEESQRPGADSRKRPESGIGSVPEQSKRFPKEDGAFSAPGDNGFAGPGNGFGGKSNGADLVYSDDDISSYKDIFDNAQTKADESDYRRVIATLKQLSTGEDLESCVDIEAVMRYFAAHNFVINYDSYTGNMLHNYYLYEENGILAMLPWDYNLAFGGFSNHSAAEAVNWPIDSPLSANVSADERPMWGQLAARTEYLKQYHSYFWSSTIKPHTLVNNE